NEALVTATSPGGPDVTATATADTPLPAAPSIALVKVGTFQDENSDGDADEGETIRYTFAVKNTGSVTLHNVRVVDRMSGVTISGNPTTLGAGETDATTFRGVYFIRQADIDAGHFFNEALALSDESQPASAAEDVDLPQNPSLKIVKDAAVPGGTANVPDEVIDYTISVQNTGNTTLTGVTVVDPFVTDLTRVADNPGNTDMRLEVGETWVYTATHTVTMADIVSNGGGDGFIENTATADSNETDPAIARASVPVTQEYIVIAPDKANCSQPYVHIVNQVTGELIRSFPAYEESYRGGVRVATGNVTGDATPEIVTAPGRNHDPWIRVFGIDGDEFEELAFLAFESFTGGVDVAVGDVVGDALNDIVVAMSYMGSRVAIFENKGSYFEKTYAFDPFGASFKGGATVALADLGTYSDGQLIFDGKTEIVVANEAGMRSSVRVFAYDGTTAHLVRSYSPFPATFRGGVSLDVARVNDDEIPDMIVGAGITGGSQVLVLDGSTGAIHTQFAAYDGMAESYHAPVRVAAVDTNNDGWADAIMTAQGSDGTTRLIRSFDPLSGQRKFEFIESTADFCGAYFLADLVFDATRSGPYEPAAVVAGPPPVDVWTNPVNPLDVNSEGIVSPLDALETINYINIRVGQTEIPAQQFYPPRFFDVTEDGAITPADVLLVVNYLNGPPGGFGEGESRTLMEGMVERLRFLPAVLDAAAPRSESPTFDHPAQPTAAFQDTGLVPNAERSSPVVERDSPRVLDRPDPWLEDPDLFGLEAVLEEISPEIAAPWLGK
ncbi:MAG TPA: dockerin type I domain-containing protein, partial [Candidatus Anammoximicrobium sp.]|nr:dockerin type I domain-containing protein [Candidatus Anammoximicrobium sp.]